MSDAGVAGKLRAQRLPRWTRQEILVLIEGKRVVERSGRGRGRGRGRGGGGGADGGGGTAAAEPTKWAAVAAYCRRHGVDRGPVQCRKRWSNLAGDYKKIREWERGKGAAGEPSSSFWAMRNDARRERRLPGFFDREVYDVLEGRAAGGNNAAEAAARVDLGDADDGKEREKPVRDDDGGAKPAGDGLFSSSSDENDDDSHEAATPPPALTPALPPTPVLVPVSEKTTEVPRLESSEQAGTSKRKGAAEFTEDSPVQGRQKRQHSDQASGRATTDLQDQLLHVLDRSGGMVAAQLEAQNINSRLDREQSKEQASSLLSVLGKMADALYRIADKL